MKILVPLTLLFSVVFFHRQAAAQVGIGTTTPNPKAVLDLRSPGNNQGFLVPKLSTAQRNAIAGLSAQDNGLMVYDTDEQKFYFWQTNQWLPLRTGADVLLNAGAGISITGNTISTLDTSPTNEIQDLQLVGGSLTITGNASATDINLAPFLGTNTDEQTLAFNATSGQLSISNGNSVTITATPTGPAGGVLSGTYPNPTIASNAITAGNIAPSTANGQVLTTVGGVTLWANPAPVQPTGAAGGHLTGTYPNPTIAPSKIEGQVLTTVAGVAQWATPPTSSGAASLDAVLAVGNDAGGRAATGFSALGINWPKGDPTGTLNVNGSQFVNFTPVVGTYPVEKNDYVIIGPSPDIKPTIVELPKAADNKGRILIIRSVSPSIEFPLVVRAISPETIDGASDSGPLAFVQGAPYSITVMSTGSEWLTVHRSIAEVRSK